MRCQPYCSTALAALGEVRSGQCSTASPNAKPVRGVPFVQILFANSRCNLQSCLLGYLANSLHKVIAAHRFIRLVAA